MHDIQRRVTRQLRKVDGSGDSFRLALQRAAQGVIARRGFTGVDKFSTALGDGGIVFGMHGSQRAGALEVAHRLQYLIIVEFVLVGQIELKAADAAIHHHRNLVENAVVNVLDNAVKTVVDNGFIGGVAAIDFELVA